MSLSTGSPDPVHDRVFAQLAAACALPSAGRSAPVFGLVEPAEADAPITLGTGGPACGGGRRVVLEGTGIASVDGARPTHLLVRATGPQGARTDGEVWVLVERGVVGVTPWPTGGDACRVVFHAARLPDSAVVATPLEPTAWSRGLHPPPAPAARTAAPVGGSSP